MKCILALVFLSGVVATVHGDMYTTQYDNVDLDEILNNKRLYEKYFNCLINKGVCTPDAEELKETIPDALQSKCSKCSEKQKAGVEKVIKHIVEYHPADFTMLESIYDKEGIYRKQWEENPDKHGIKLPPKA